MALLKDGILHQDEWQFLADEEPLPEEGAIIVSWLRWKKERDALVKCSGKVGVRIANTQSVFELAGDLERFASIEIEFPKFTDGRAYSQARQLRDNLGFRGEIRARGIILRDQYLFMIRCGISSVVLPEGAKIDGYRAALGEYSVWYQPASDHRQPIFALRHLAPAAE